MNLKHDKAANINSEINASKYCGNSHTHILSTRPGGMKSFRSIFTVDVCVQVYNRFRFAAALAGVSVCVCVVSFVHGLVLL